MSRRGWTRTLLGLALIGVLAGCEPISEPWVSAEDSWGRQIENERTRSDEQQRELRQRLEYSGAGR